MALKLSWFSHDVSQACDTNVIVCVACIRKYNVRCALKKKKHCEIHPPRHPRRTESHKNMHKHKQARISSVRIRKPCFCSVCTWFFFFGHQGYEGDGKFVCTRLPTHMRRNSIDDTWCSTFIYTYMQCVWWMCCGREHLVHFCLGKVLFCVAICL